MVEQIYKIMTPWAPVGAKNRLIQSAFISVKKVKQFCNLFIF